MELPTAQHLAQQVFSVSTKSDFEATAGQIFTWQYANNKIYKAYCDALKRSPANIACIRDIPFLPISFFKTHNVVCGEVSINTLRFESSGTTGQQPSRHWVTHPPIYEASFRNTFARFYSHAARYAVLGLLPSYLERQHSSLVYMVTDLIGASGAEDSGFYLHDFEKLAAVLQRREAAGQKTVLFGVTYALLDFAELFQFPLRHTIIIETGGMKGRNKELLREEVHGRLQQAFAGVQIDSEYGMTELLSQGYMTVSGTFRTPPWMQVFVREEDDPLRLLEAPATGGINIIDLANIYSCAFVATEDVGQLFSDGSFRVLGRLDHAEIRGCSLLSI